MMHSEICAKTIIIGCYTEKRALRRDEAEPLDKKKRWWVIPEVRKLLRHCVGHG